MVVDPQVRRRLTSAVFNELPDAARDRWNTWARQVPPLDTIELPYDLAEIALRAVSASARTITRRLDQDDIEGDVRSDLLNDLGFVQDIEATLVESVGR
jgi:hypothetical protein